MEIRNIRHKGLRQFVEKGQPKSLPPEYLGKIADIMAFLVAMEEVEEIFSLPKFKPHRMRGGRAGTYSLHVTANWRITFRYNERKNELYDIDFEDYH